MFEPRTFVLHRSEKLGVLVEIGASLFQFRLKHLTLVLEDWQSNTIVTEICASIPLYFLSMAW